MNVETKKFKEKSFLHVSLWNQQVCVHRVIVYSHRLIHSRRVIRTLKTMVLRKSSLRPSMVIEMKFTFAPVNNNITKRWPTTPKEVFKLKLFKESIPTWFQSICTRTAASTLWKTSDKTGFNREFRPTNHFSGQTSCSSHFRISFLLPFMILGWNYFQFIVMFYDSYVIYVNSPFKHVPPGSKRATWL